MDSAGIVNTGNITTIAIVAILVVVVIGAVLSFVITAIVVRLLIVVVVVVLGLLVWQQRSSIQDKVNTKACKLGTTFFGVHVDVPSSVRSACATRS